jgi:hypothetical protein
VSILLAAPGGGFVPEVRYPLPLEAGALALGDLNEDGHDDLIVSGTHAEAVAVLLSNADGTFAEATRFDTAFKGGAVTAGDYDGDGDVDVSMTSWFGLPVESPPSAEKTLNHMVGSIWLFFGTGDGGLLNESIASEAVGAGPTDVAVGDFNQDGIPDLATADQDANQVSVLLGQGAGEFSPAASFLTGTEPLALVVGDVVGAPGADGIEDLVVVAQTAEEVSILAGLGDGSFGTAIPLALGRRPDDVALSDLNADGLLDIVTVNGYAQDVSVLLAMGDGEFSPPVTLDGGPVPLSVAVADLDGDGIPDLAVANVIAEEVSILAGNGDGSFGPRQAYAVGTRAYSVVAADFDRDGVPDLVIGNSGASFPLQPTATVLRGLGDGSFGPPQAVELGEGPSSVAVADVTDDGLLDLVTGHGSAMIRVSPGRGDLTFDPPQAYAVAGQNSHVAVADLNGDGKLDVAASNGTRDRVSILLNQGPSRMVFEADKATLSWVHLPGTDRYTMYRGDLATLVDGDGDGLPDGGYGSCRTASDPDPTDTMYADDEMPAAGTGFFYLMGRIGPRGERALGVTSAGLPRIPARVCL